MPKFNPLQEKVLNYFKDSSLKNSFYWTGGTLLSVVYLQHRLSQDLDFFSDHKFYHSDIAGFVKDLQKKLNLTKVEEKKIHDRYEFFLYNKEKLRLEFVYYPHDKIKSRKKWNNITIDSLDDLATNKTMAFFDRNDPKDLFDLYFLLTKKKYTPKKLLKLVENKFGVSFSESSFWSETYKAFKDLENLQPLLLVPKQKRKQLINKIKEYFIEQSTQFTKKIIK